MKSSTWYDGMSYQFRTSIKPRALAYKQERHTYNASLVFSWVRVNRSLALCLCFVDRCLSFCTFSFGHCVVCPSSMYGCWKPSWYLQTILIPPINHKSLPFQNVFWWKQSLTKLSNSVLNGCGILTDVWSEIRVKHSSELNCNNR